MKKFNLLLGTLILIGIIFTGCNGKDNVTAETAAAGDTANDAKTVTSQTADIGTCETYEELQEKVGFMPLELPEYYTYNVTTYSYSAGIASIEQTAPDDENISVAISSGRGEQNLTVGIAEKENDTEVLGVAVKTGTGGDNESYRCASWTENDMSYAIDTLNMSEEDFSSMLEDLVNATK